MKRKLICYSIAVMCFFLIVLPVLPSEAASAEQKLFDRFCETVSGNPDLNEYREYVYRLYPVVEDHLAKENEEYFFERLATLTIVSCDSTDFAGGFMPWLNRIEIAPDASDYADEAQFAMTVYHELLHFIDSNIDGPGTYLLRKPDGSLVETCEITDEDLETGATELQAVYWVEGGVEKYAAEYFSGAPECGAYQIAVQFLVGMEYIFGSKKTDELYFAHNTDYLFAELLKENGFSDEEIVRLFNVMQKMLDREEPEPDRFMDPQEALIRLYINNVGPDYMKDATFCRILASVEDSLLKEIPSEYREFTSGLHGFTEKDIFRLTEYVADELNCSAESISFILTPTPIFLNGELTLSGMFCILEEDGTWHCKTAVFDYDFETDTVNGCEIFEEWAPQSTVRKLQSEDSEEGRALVKELTLDNAAAHKQKAKGSIPELKKLYKKAVKIGNKYGVYIMFADRIPKGVLFNDDTAATDPSLINKALKQIDKVLALYPEGFFDQFLFEYYSGVYIILYDGWYEYAFSDTVYVDGKHYLALYVDVSLDKVQGHFGEAAIKRSYFKKVKPLSSELICDIWCLTEKLISLRSIHFEEPLFDEESWQAYNPSGFTYADSEDAKVLKARKRKSPMQYFICTEALSSARTERLLVNEYVMLSKLTGKDPAKLTPECRAKATEVKRAIECIVK